MSLRRVRLENFRGFERAEIEFKPLTVLVGSNSSGKSSFSHALSVLSHAHRNYSSSPRLTLTPGKDGASWPADLGDLLDVRRSGAQGPIRISIETDEGELTWGFGLDTPDAKNPNLEISYVRQPEGLDASSGQIPLAEPTSFVPVAASGSYVFDTSYPGAAAGIHEFEKYNQVQWRDTATGKESFVDFRGLILEGAGHRSATHSLLSYPLRREVDAIFSGLTYLRAIRTRPSRSYENRFSGEYPLVGYDGEGFVSLLYAKAADHIQMYMPPIEKTELLGKHSILRSEWKLASTTLIEALKRWMLHLHLATDLSVQPHPKNPDLLQIRIAVGHGALHDISEVGFGLSQVLPIIVAGLLQPKEAPFVVDLPEAHLHPRPQALLADFFCGLALADRRSLVETHSEMFVNQLRLRAAMDPRLKDKIAVYFLDEAKDGSCCKPRLIGLDEAGQLQWPTGFLEEAWDIESKISDIRIAERVKQ